VRKARKAWRRIGFSPAATPVDWYVTEGYSESSWFSMKNFQFECGVMRWHVGTTSTSPSGSSLHDRIADGEPGSRAFFCVRRRTEARSRLVVEFEFDTAIERS